MSGCQARSRRRPSNEDTFTFRILIIVPNGLSPTWNCASEGLLMEREASPARAALREENTVRGLRFHHAAANTSTRAEICALKIRRLRERLAAWRVASPSLRRRSWQECQVSSARAALSSLSWSELVFMPQLIQQNLLKLFSQSGEAGFQGFIVVACFMC